MPVTHCSKCAKPFAAELFRFRSDTQSWRSECKECYNSHKYYTKYRVKKKEEFGGKWVALTRKTEAKLPDCCSECGKGFATDLFTWRTDQACYRTICKECINKRKYYEAFREKKKADDEEAYKNENNQRLREWRANNPDKWAAYREQRKVSVRHQWTVLKASAKQRGIDVCLADEHALKAKMEQPCSYCGYADEGLSGLDRVDNCKGYDDVNTVPCCAICNQMKASSSVDEFLQGVAAISTHAPVSVVPDTRGALPPHFANRRGCEKRLKRNFLTREEAQQLRESPCYLCGVSPATGIDRVDSAGEYTTQNSRSCCSRCNYMKKDLELHAFLLHVHYIAVFRGV